MRDFVDRTAVVTGAANGIGLALARILAQRGMRVVLADVDPTSLGLAVEGLESEGHRVLGVVTDVMDEESVRNLYAESKRWADRIHILVNNAGVLSRSEGLPVWETPDEDWSWVMGVNLWGVLYGLRAFVPHMIDHGEPGHIVNTASLASLVPGVGPYSVSKHGLLALSEGLWTNLRDKRIGVSLVCPGYVNTRIVDSERLRPEDLASEAPEIPSSVKTALNEMFAKGVPAEAVADQVVNAIVEERFYVLSHPAWDNAVRSRVDAVLARGNPVRGVNI